jgi:glycosyl transferase family 25
VDEKDFAAMKRFRLRTIGKEIAIACAYSAYNFAARSLPRLHMLPKEPFAALETFFDEVWVLTIPRNKARQEAFVREFDGLHFLFHEGVDGKTIEENDRRIDYAQAVRNSGRRVRINELACTLSHVVMFEEIVRRGLERVMIFEDDAVFDRRMAKWVPYCLERLPGEWDLFYMGYRDGELRGFVTEAAERLGFRHASTPVVSRSVGRGLRTAAGHDFTHAYCVSLSGARKLLADAYPIRYTADGWLEHKVFCREVNAYISVPKIFHQLGALGSSIHANS